VPPVGKGKKKGKKGQARVAKLPKKKCCESRSRCNRCPLRMLKEGSLPAGYTVHKRKLVTVEKASSIKAAKQAKKAGKAA
jgi:hypothetical protein